MAVHQIDSIEKYDTYLKKTASEIEILFKDLLIGVTNFFRDAEAFGVLKAKVIPQLIKNKKYEIPLRIWVAGCATGEEAYSIAILLAEVMDKLRPFFHQRRQYLPNQEADSGHDRLCRPKRHQRSSFFQIRPGELQKLADLYGNRAAKKDFTAFPLHVNSSGNLISGHF
jgi:hypothetical protein